MSRVSIARGFSLLIAIMTATLLSSAVWAADKEALKQAPKDSGTVGGLLVEKKNDYIMVQIDGDPEPTKFLVGTMDQRAADLYKSIFDVDRISVKWKADGDAKRVVSIEKLVGRPQGIVIGEVLKVYNNFWVAVKPKTGQIDGYALSFPQEKYKASYELIKTLKPGDIVAIRYTTDYERHRIQEMEVKPAPAPTAPKKP